MLQTDYVTAQHAPPQYTFIKKGIFVDTFGGIGRYVIHIGPLGPTVSENTHFTRPRTFDGSSEIFLFLTVTYLEGSGRATSTRGTRSVSI